MSARIVRRTFAAPFVITLATACSSSSSHTPPHNNPPDPNWNAHSDAAQPPIAEPTPGPTEPTPSVVIANNPPAPYPGVDPQPVDKTPPPKREPSQFERKWTVTKATTKGKTDCYAMPEVKCPKVEKGQPIPTCNPPAPYPYTCPPGFAAGDSLNIILRVGATECFVDRQPMKCPKGAMCNPPPPQKIVCPG